MMAGPLHRARAALESPDPEIGTALGNVNEAILRHGRIEQARTIIAGVVRKWPREAPDAQHLRRALELLASEPDTGVPPEPKAPETGSEDRDEAPSGEVTP